MKKLLILILLSVAFLSGNASEETFFANIRGNKKHYPIQGYVHFEKGAVACVVGWYQVDPFAQAMEDNGIHVIDAGYDQTRSNYVVRLKPHDIRYIHVNGLFVDDDYDMPYIRSHTE